MPTLRERTDDILPLARHFVQRFSRELDIPGLRLINLVKPPTRTPEEYIHEAYPFFQPVVQMHGGAQPPGPPETWPQWFPRNCRVIFECAAGSREEAVGLAERLQEIRAGHGT